MLTVFLFLFSIAVGFVILDILTHNNSPVHKKLPQIRIKVVQLSPNIKIRISGRIFHIHHWIVYSVVLVVSFTHNVELLSSWYAKGFLTGAILQGFSFPDWKRVIIRETDKLREPSS